MSSYVKLMDRQRVQEEGRKILERLFSVLAIRTTTRETQQATQTSYNGKCVGCFSRWEKWSYQHRRERKTNALFKGWKGKNDEIDPDSEAVVAAV